VDNLNTLSAIQSKVQLPLSAVTVVPSPASQQPMQSPDSVATNFSEIANKNNKSVDSLLDNRQELTHAMEELKRLADNSGRSLGFTHDDALSVPVITVSDLETGQVIRQIPTEVVVRVAHSIEKMKGLLFDKSL
jgi:flagellar protein FlaG